MKKLFKFLGYLLVIVIVVVAGALCFVKFGKPGLKAATNLKVESTPARVEHGKYLANHVMLCLDCHGTRDWTKYSGPLVPGTEGKGGELFDQNFGFPGKFYSRNITPYKLKDWTDGEIFRTITTGVDKNGEPLFPVMPYHYYGQLDKEDIYDVIAYIRTLPAIENNIPKSEPDVPMNFIMRLIPEEAKMSTKPSESDPVAWGKYMVLSSGCVECHTPAEKGQIIAGKEFNGGREFMLPSGVLRSANITPDPTGIGALTEDMFVLKFKAYVDSSYKVPTVGEKQMNTIMPWMMYGGMKESDLRAIYKYLRTLPPVNNTVTKWTPKA